MSANHRTGGGWGDLEACAAVRIAVVMHVYEFKGGEGASEGALKGYVYLFGS